MLRLAGDDRLVALIRADNEAAFEVVYDRYHRQLLSFCRHMLGHAEEAEDAVQQTFISAHADLNRSERPIALRAWLFTIARNRCLSILRARRETATLEDVQPETGGLAAEVEGREDLRTMLSDIARLPDDQRAALVLAELGDLDHGDIAAVVGCPKEKVKALVFQARSSLALSRQARETSCEEIREQLATLRGGALRRTALRRHLRGCAGCREFRDEVRRQRSAMAVLLPVVPAAGLKNAVLAGAGLSASGAGSGAGAGVGLAGAKLAVLKGAVAVAIVGAGAAGGAAVVQQIDSGSGTPRHGAPAVSHAHEAAAGTAGSGVSSVAESAAAGSVSAAAHGPAAAHSNRTAALQNALAHGRGLKRGLLGTQPGKTKTSTSSHGQGVGRGGRGQGSTGSTNSSGNSNGNGQGRGGTSSPGNASHESHSNSNASPVAGSSESESIDPSTSGSSRGRAYGLN